MVLNMSYYQNVSDFITSNFAEKTIESSDLLIFKEHVNKDIFLEILNEIINNDILLSRIADRSYTHALGFDKIVLIDLNKDYGLNKTQLRLHLWHPQHDSLPITESLHEHSFNFISMVLNGELENQSFEKIRLNSFYLTLLEHLNTALSNCNKDEISFLNDQIELIEVMNLKKFDSKQYHDQANIILQKSEIIDLLNLKSNTEFFNESNIYDLSKLQKYYSSDRVQGEKKDYKHVFKENVGLIPFSVESIKKDEYYFHPYELPHRLYYDNKELNSTLLVTTPIASNPQGGSLQRPTYLAESEKGYSKIAIMKEELKSKLINLREYL